jgi:hypothetical protein
MRCSEYEFAIFDPDNSEYSDIYLVLQVLLT